MIADEEKYQRLIKYDKIMITLAGIICVIISAYVVIQMNTIIIPLKLALIINFKLNTILTFFEKKINFQFCILSPKVNITVMRLIENNLIIPNLEPVIGTSYQDYRGCLIV